MANVKRHGKEEGFRTRTGRPTYRRSCKSTWELYKDRYTGKYKKSRGDNGFVPRDKPDFTRRSAMEDFVL